MAKITTQQPKTIKVTLIRSGIGTTERQRLTLRGLGLTRLNKTVELKNTAPVRGMINKMIQWVRYEV
ncbi:MAG: 50S ribosomal protein L30 [Deltaproteobacteria bacterium GWA2_38_16]|nr:MAG: 50S ribosomal protein L30 [Deltaproteobacteria bacterium GWA2_38_16]OGQ03799.1 MAG: 50S ribosomal protein L30 [Deltaproteobacteria bacterium RIFCSPHIGHO2_02_FULL_38_15]OGQ34307.1 MAG: 50S ribosomal protein L30 [Deltaproteobacteria bacterium RIFCSPLOWO2_01_FULL_38_9]OGQ59148.1 MAG: 50S ribosomal protein L30 [Deltaproteobacteria bacterium RIFCSPLOWO2_12_FULL_38_8]HBQ20840.1 50S ribosomal protein L30 [Deltaproteobacteria bacterium]